MDFRKNLTNNSYNLTSETPSSASSGWCAPTTKTEASHFMMAATAASSAVSLTTTKPVRVAPASVLIVVISIEICRIIVNTAAASFTIVFGHFKTHLQSVNQTGG